VRIMHVVDVRNMPLRVDELEFAFSGAMRGGKILITRRIERIKDYLEHFVHHLRHNFLGPFARLT